VVVSNFLFRPERAKEPLEIFDPPPPIRSAAPDPNGLHGAPIPFGIANSGFVAIARQDAFPIPSAAHPPFSSRRSSGPATGRSSHPRSWPTTFGT
jgi:hypothetical protein